MKTINDEVFGEMSYDYAWEQSKKDIIFSKLSDYKVVAQAYPGDSITDAQRKSYKEYKQKEESFWKQIPDQLLLYYLENYETISELVNIPERLDKNHINRDSITKLVRLNTLYFDREGRYGWLCDCAWDKEHGICIILSDDSITIDVQDALL